MAVLETIRSLFVPVFEAESEDVVPAPPSEYAIKPLTMKQLPDVLRLNIRCFRNGDNYTKHTFNFLLSEPRTLSYRMESDAGDMAAFAFVMLNDRNSAHLTTIGKHFMQEKLELSCSRSASATSRPSIFIVSAATSSYSGSAGTTTMGKTVSS